MVAALAVGGRPRLPHPFGVARNGLVAYANGGDIYTVDPASGIAKAVVTGPETDLKPGLLAPLGRTSSSSAKSSATPATAGCSSPVPMAAGSSPSPAHRSPSSPVTPSRPTAARSPSHLGPDATSDLWIAKADGSGARHVDVGMSVQGRRIGRRTEPRSSSRAGRRAVPEAASTRSTSPPGPLEPSSGRPPASGSTGSGSRQMDPGWPTPP